MVGGSLLTVLKSKCSCKRELTGRAFAATSPVSYHGFSFTSPPPFVIIWSSMRCIRSTISELAKEAGSAGAYY
jgi:hypothetical protein